MASPLSSASTASTADLELAAAASSGASRRLWQHKSFVIAGSVLAVIVLMALAAPLIAPYDPYAQDLANRLVPPAFMEGGSWAHPLGTDPLGRDYLSRVIYGARVSLMIGLLTALLSGLIGAALGITAGYFGGRVDALICYVLAVRLSMPVVLVALAVVSVIGGSLSVVIAVLGLLLWDRYAVVLRSATQQVRSLDFVVAAQAVGASTARIILTEVLPNVMSNLIVVATFEVAHAILLEAALSFLGLGVQPPLPSWGLMIAEGRQYLLFEPWVIVIPGIALSVLVLSVNMLGDGIRDLAAPENRN
ncbi:MAG TPA: ABC transporter permease [Burkholderiales bacterium]|jgi:peptide/nickel transport system permease protein|nr:ABC transporter permease [Burkholderiales bacterium]